MRERLLCYIFTVILPAFFLFLLVRIPLILEHFKITARKERNKKNLDSLFVLVNNGNFCLKLQQFSNKAKIIQTDELGFFPQGKQEQISI